MKPRKYNVNLSLEYEPYPKQIIQIEVNAIDEDDAEHEAIHSLYNLLRNDCSIEVLNVTGLL